MTTLVATASEGNTAYPQIPVGMHNARCIKVIGLGTQKQEFSGPTAGQAPDYIQTNVVILDKSDALDFLIFCQNFVDGFRDSI